MTLLPDPAPDRPEEGPGLRRLLMQLWAAVLGLARSETQLAVAEVVEAGSQLRRAAAMAATALLAIVLAAVLGLCALAFGLVAAGLPAWLALALAAAAMAGLAAFCASRARRSLAMAGSLPGRLLSRLPRQTETRDQWRSSDA